MAAAGQLGHDALGVHAAGQHVAVVAIAGDDGVALFERHLHADHHGLLADVEVAEAADQAHAVHLAGLLLEAPDQQHVAIGLEFRFLAKVGNRGLLGIDRLLVVRLVTGGRRAAAGCALSLATAMALLGQSRRRSTAINPIA